MENSEQTDVPNTSQGRLLEVRASLLLLVIAFSAPILFGYLHRFTGISALASTAAVSLILLPFLLLGVIGLSIYHLIRTGRKHAVLELAIAVVLLALMIHRWLFRL